MLKKKCCSLEDAEGFGGRATVFVSEMRSYLFPQVQLNETFTVGMRGRAKISMRLVQETIQASTPSEGPSANPSLLELHV